MKMYTAMLIQNRDVYAGSFEQAGKHGLLVLMADETPSGFERPRVLLSSAPIYDTSEAAKAVAEEAIAMVKATDLTALQSHIESTGGAA